MNRTIRQICDWWKKTIADRRLSRGLPSVAERKQKIAALRSRHRSTKSIIAEQCHDIHEALGMRRGK